MEVSTPVPASASATWRLTNRSSSRAARRATGSLNPGVQCLCRRTGVAGPQLSSTVRHTWRNYYGHACPTRLSNVREIFAQAGAPYAPSCGNLFHSRPILHNPLLGCRYACRHGGGISGLSKPWSCGYSLGLARIRYHLRCGSWFRTHSPPRQLGSGAISNSRVPRRSVAFLPHLQLRVALTGGLTMSRVRVSRCCPTVCLTTRSS